MITNIEKIDNLIKGFPTITMYRINFGSKRGYVMTEPFSVYSGLTGALSAATFKGNQESKRLGGWREKQQEKLGIEGAEAYLNMTADFGSLSHEAIVRIKDNGCIDWAYENDYAASYFENSARSNGVTPSAEVIRMQVFEYSKVIASILQFVYEQVTEIHSVEGMTYSDKIQVATPIDITCTLKDKKVDKRVTLNLKTSKQFTAHHREQVCLEKYLWNSTYPDFQVQATGLLRAKDWSIKKLVPTYELELIDEQTEHFMLKDAMSRLLICKDAPDSTYLTFPKTVNTFSGITKAGEAPTLISKSIEQLFNESLKKDI